MFELDEDLDKPEELPSGSDGDAQGGNEQDNPGVIEVLSTGTKNRTGLQQSPSKKIIGGKNNHCGFFDGSDDEMLAEQPIKNGSTRSGSAPMQAEENRNRESREQSTSVVSAVTFVVGSPLDEEKHRRKKATTFTFGKNGNN